MRKELIVYVNMFEKGEEIAVSSLAINRDYVIINTGNAKAVVNVAELKRAIQELEDFESSKDAKNSPVQEIPVIDVTYGDDQ